MILGESEEYGRTQTARDRGRGRQREKNMCFEHAYGGRKTVEHAMHAAVNSYYVQAEMLNLVCRAAQRGTMLLLLSRSPSVWLCLLYW